MITPTPSPTISEIEAQCKALAHAREDLADTVHALNKLLDRITRRSMRAIKTRVADAAQEHQKLAALMSDAKDLFKKPKTQVFHGIKVGYVKGSGAITFEDEDLVIKLIKKHFTEEEAETLIQTTEKVRKSGLNTLDVADLKRIGCNVGSTNDVMVIKPVDTEVDKTVKALMKGATDAIAEIDV